MYLGPCYFEFKGQRPNLVEVQFCSKKLELVKYHVSFVYNTDSIITILSAQLCG